MKSITFEIDGHLVEARPNESILEASLRTKVPVSSSCGGFGTCGACRVLIEEGAEKLNTRSDLELEMAADRDFEDNERLACQTSPAPGLRVRRPNGSGVR